MRRSGTTEAAFSLKTTKIKWKLVFISSQVVNKRSCEYFCITTFLCSSVSLCTVGALTTPPRHLCSGRCYAYSPLVANLIWSVTTHQNFRLEASCSEQHLWIKWPLLLCVAERENWAEDFIPIVSILQVTKSIMTNYVRVKTKKCHLLLYKQMSRMLWGGEVERSEDF